MAIEALPPQYAQPPRISEAAHVSIIGSSDPYLQQICAYVRELGDRQTTGGVLTCMCQGENYSWITNSTPEVCKTPPDETPIPIEVANTVDDKDPEPGETPLPDESATAAAARIISGPTATGISTPEPTPLDQGEQPIIVTTPTLRRAVTHNGPDFGERVGKWTKDRGEDIGDWLEELWEKYWLVVATVGISSPILFYLIFWPAVEESLDKFDNS